MNATRIAIAFIGTEIGLAALFGVTGATGHLHGTAYASPTTCQEDQPCWNPCTMGNRVGYDPALGRIVDCRWEVV